MNNKIIKKTINFYLTTQNKIKNIKNFDWAHSEVEAWKKNNNLFTNELHISNFRRSFISGGTLNPPDRPFKISAKYHGINEDKLQWFEGYNFLEKIRGILYIISRYRLLNARLIKIYLTEGIDLKSIKDNLVGNPISFSFFKFSNLTEASLRFTYYVKLFNKILNFKNLGSVLEIGAGYGGLANKFFSLNPYLKQYVIVDLPENLTLAYYYLINNGHKVTIYIDKIDKPLKDIKGIILVAPWVLKDIQNSNFDLALNIMSFQHMSKKNIIYYFNILNAINIKYFYYLNRNKIRDASDVIANSYPKLNKLEIFIDNIFDKVFVERFFKNKLN